MKKGIGNPSSAPFPPHTVIPRGRRIPTSQAWALRPRRHQHSVLAGSSRIPVLAKLRGSRINDGASDAPRASARPSSPIERSRRRPYFLYVRRRGHTFVLWVADLLQASKVILLLLKCSSL
jgi:hypothetical protein